MTRLAIAGLGVLGLLPVLGRFLPPTWSWGFHHAAYLPFGATLLLCAGWLLLWIPALRDPIDRALFEWFSPRLFRGPALWPVLVCLTAVGGFLLLRTPVHLLGDGVLVGELVGKGADFRAHDAMDYLLHRAVFRALSPEAKMADSFRIYTVGSWIAGALAVTVALGLLRRSRLPDPQKLLVFGLWLFAAPTLLYCGYVESYGYLSVALLGFLWSGALARRGEIAPWIPGLFFGLALFFHTTALFAAPALLWLALRPAGPRAGRKGWAAQVLLPAAALPLIAIAIHVAAGYDQAWLRREFLESKNQKRVLIPWTGPHGLFSIIQLKDSLNWLLLVLPVTGWLVILRMGIGKKPGRAVVGPRSPERQHPLRRPPEESFLLVQAASFLLPFLLLDRKLGAARDWDLLVAQVAGFPFLAAVLWMDVEEAGDGKGRRILPSVRFAALWVALLMGVPWFAVNAGRESSLRRYDEIRRDFAPHPRSYAAEELAKYFRDHGDTQRSLGYYQECVEIFPHNARTRTLLGTNYLMLGRIEEAKAQYDKAIEIDPDNWMALDVRGKLAIRMKDYATALRCFRDYVAVRSNDVSGWVSYGHAALQQKAYQEAYDAFVRAAALRPDPVLYYSQGIAAVYLRRWDEGIAALHQAVRITPTDEKYLHALAAAYEARYVEAGKSGSRSDLDAAFRLAQQSLAMKPEDPGLKAYARHLESVIAGSEPARNEMRP
jgi:tetratricopeptide (TPR) repeat protein